MPREEFGAVLRRRRREVGAIALDVVVAGGVTWLNVIASGRVHWPVVTFAVVCAALLVRRRWPLVAMAAAVGCILAGGPLLAAVVALYTVACCRGPRVWTWVSLVATFAAVGGTALVGDDWQYVALGAGLFTLVPALAGLWMWQRRRLLDALRARAEQAERERHLLAERSVAAERRRIAGEMHDVVAHRVSVIAVQAGALTAVSDDDQVNQVAEVIRTNSSAALAELRDLLRVLREDEPGVGVPAPTLDSLTALAEEFRRAGAVVDLELPDPVPTAPAQVTRAVYRLTQEALTNAGKHARGAPVRIAITDGEDELAVAVVNAAPGGPQPSAGLPTSGFGLVGMRERVNVAGGTLTNGPTPDGGYAVRATFPRQAP